MPVVSRPFLLRVGYHVALAASAGAVLGAYDGWTAVTASTLPIVVDAAIGAGVVATAAALVGVVQGVAIALLGPVIAHSNVARAWLRGTDSRRDAEREPVVRFHASVVAAALLVASLHFVFRWFVAGSGEIKDVALRLDLTVLLALGALIAAAAGTWLLAPLLRPPLSWLDARWGLPLPRQRLARYTLYVFLPVVLTIWPLFTVYGVKLGVLTRVLGAALFFVVQGLLHRVAFASWSLLPPRRWLRNGILAGVVSCLAVLVVASGVAASVHRLTIKVITNGHVMPVATDWLQRLTDVDGDGISTVYGGRDCAPFDSTRSPAHLDVPGNGIDEDCDGADALPTSGVPELRTYLSERVTSDSRKYNVLWVVVDSLRPDHMDLYGYAEKTSPGLTQLGRESWVFLNAYSQSSTTSISMPSMLAGRRPDRMNWVNKTFPAAAAGERMLAEILRDAGYLTTLVSNSYVKSRLPDLARGYDEVMASPSAVNWRSGDVAVRNMLLAMATARSKNRPFFVTVHIDDVHHPYRSHRGRALPKFDKTTGEERENRADYDRTIANFDNLFNTVLTNIRHTDLWDDTIIIVTSDHGEEFKEHGGTIHSTTCYEELVHVPLIVRVPGKGPRRIRSRVSMIDVVPTLAELIGLDRDALDLDGQSLLVPVMSPRSVDADRPIFCSVYQLLSGRKNFYTRSVRTAERTLVHEVLSDRVELYDTQIDPREQKDLSTDPGYADDVARMKALLRAANTGNLFSVRRFQ